MLSSIFKSWGPLGLLSCFVILCTIGTTSAEAQRTTTVAEMMAERDLTTRDKKKTPYCSGGVFKPCVCASSVTKRVMYRPSVRECRGAAAVLLSGSYVGAFSVVIRDLLNNDRIPSKSLVNGCTRYERDVLALAKCSVYKAQKVIRVSDKRGSAKVFCMGASGYSTYFQRARRITVKLADSPNDSNDPLVRLCLAGPTEDLN